MNQWLVVVISLGSAFAFAGSTVLKHASAGQVPDAQALTGRSLLRFIRATLSHPLWLGSIGTDVIGLGLQIIALHFGALSVVQPLLITSLLFALVLRSSIQRPSKGQLIAGTVVVATLGAFLVLLQSGGGTHLSVADKGPAVIAATTGALFAVVCVLVARRQDSATTSAALLGVSAGAAYAATAAMLKGLSNVVVSHPAALLTDWQLYATIVVGAAGLLLGQLAFQAGPLTASLPAMATIDPLASVAIGVWIYDEHVRRGSGAGIGLVALLILLGIAVVYLARTEMDQKQPVTAR